MLVESRPAASLARLFEGRRDLHARRKPGGRWMPVPEAPDREALERHARGEIDLGLYPHPTQPCFLVLQAEDEESARALHQAVHARSVPAVTHGLDLWVPFAEPVPVRTAASLGDVLAGAAGGGARVADANTPQLLPREADRSLEPLPPWRAERLLAERRDKQFGPLPLARHSVLLASGTSPSASAEAPGDGTLHVILQEHVEVHGPVPLALERLLEGTRMSRTPRGWVRCWGRVGGALVAAPAVWADLRDRLDRLGIPYRVEDRRLAGTPRPLRRRPTPWAELLERERVRLHPSDPEEGRRLVRAAIGARALPTLVVTERVEDWVAELGEDLGVPRGEIGLLAGGEAWLGPMLSVASWRTLAGRDLTGLARYIGHLVLDEGAAAPAMVEVVRQFAARYVLTLQSTRRSHGLEAMLAAWLGEPLRPGPRALPPLRSDETAAPRVASAPRPRSKKRESRDQLLLSFED